MLLRRVEGLRRRDHAEERAEGVVVLGRRPDAADALDVDGVAEAHVAELGDGPAEAVVVDGSRPDGLCSSLTSNETPTRTSYLPISAQWAVYVALCLPRLILVAISGRYGLARAV